MKLKIKKSVLALSLTVSVLITGCTSNDTTPEKSTLTSISDLATDSVTLISLGNEDVPVGRYAEEVLINSGIWDDIQDKISYATSVKEVLSQVALGAATCGIVYATDAVTSDGVIVVEEIDSSLLESPVIYPAAVMSNSTNKDAANCFLAYLTETTSIATLEANGFTVLPEETTTNKTILEPCTLTIFAAASLMESITEISESFMAEHEGVEIVASYDSSGTLSTQIQYGADVDVFLSASTDEFDTLIDLDYITEDNVIELLSNKLVLITAASAE